MNLRKITEILVLAALSTAAVPAPAMAIEYVCKPSGLCMRWFGENAFNRVRVEFWDSQHRATHYNFKKAGGTQSEQSAGDVVEIHRYGDDEIVQVQWCIKPTIGRSECGPWEQFYLDTPSRREQAPKSQAPAPKPIVIEPEMSTDRVRSIPRRVLSAPCAKGFVWREASENDFVCVTPEVRSRSAEENRQAAARRDPDGAYGPQSCIAGFVWREAFSNDTVCVTPEIRTQVRRENEQGPSRRASP